MSASTGIEASSEPVFTIGSVDNSDREFALAPDGWSRYQDTFPKDPVFTVGRSDPGTDWPYVQPGPNGDAWAGNRAHTFTIEYTLDEDQVKNQVLTLHLLDTYTRPPKDIVKSNDLTVASETLPAGTGKGILGTGGKPTTFRVFVPASTLHAGTNTITITTAAGNWQVYDAVVLAPLAGPGPIGPGPIYPVSVEPTVFFVADQGTDRQLVNVDIVNTGADTTTTLTARLGGESATTTLQLPTGSSRQQIKVPPAPRGAPTALQISTESGAVLDTTLAYQRRWTYGIVHGTHFDNGFTATAEGVHRTQDTNLDQVVQECQRTADFPPAARFRWTIEEAMTASEYLKDRSPGKVDALADCVARGQVELTAKADSNLDDMSTPEQMIREQAVGQTVSRRLNAPITTAIQNDVPGMTWQKVQTLEKAGVENLIMGRNEDETGFSDEDKTGIAKSDQQPPALFWWKAPNGSKLLTWYSGNLCSRTRSGYSDMNLCMFSGAAPSKDFSGTVGRLGDRLAQVESQGFSGSHYLSESFFDNRGPQLGLSEFVKRYNETYSWPKISMTTPTEYFNEVRKTEGDSLPVKSGEFSDWWSLGSGSAAGETAQNRQAQARTTSAETLGSLAGLNVPTDGGRQDDVDAAYENEELFTEHNWGHSGQLANDEVWAYHRRFATEADRLSRSAKDSALRDLATTVHNPGPWPSIAVFNSLSWKRSDVVTAKVDVPSGSSDFSLVDEDQPVPYEVVDRTGDTATLRFLARDVPGIGYKTYQLEPGESNPSDADGAIHADTSGMENQYFRIRFDPDTGTIASIYDKARGKELVDTGSHYQVNQYIYRPNPAGTKKGNHQPTSPDREWTPTHGTIRVVNSGPVSATVEVRQDPGPGAGTTGVSAITQRITLDAASPRIEINNTLDKDRVVSAEEGYFAFPFKVDDPRVTYEVPGMQVGFFDDQLPDSALDNQAIYGYANISNRAGGVTFSSDSTPLVEFDHIRTQERVVRPGRLDDQPKSVDPSKYLPKNGSLFSLAFNNLWDTSFPATQTGRIGFNYAITSHEGEFNAVRETHFGREAMTPLSATAVQARQHGPLKPGAHAMVSVDQPQVEIQTVKQAEGRPGLTMRLLNLSDEARQVTLTLPFDPGTATVDDPLENPLSELPVRGRKLSVPVEPHGIATVTASPELALTAKPADGKVVNRNSQKRIVLTLHNEGKTTVTSMLQLAAPPSLDVRPVGTSQVRVDPGKTGSATFDVAVPDGYDRDSATLTGTAQTEGEPGPVITRTTLAIVDPGSLATAYNSACVSDDSDMAGADCDTTRYSYSAQGLAAAGLTPGKRIRAGDMMFTWPDVSAGEPDNATENGRTVDVSGAPLHSSRLGFLGMTDSFDPSQATVEITYTDGSTKSATIGFSNWTLDADAKPPAFGNTIVAKVPSRNASTGSPQPINVYVFATAPITIDPNKTIKSVTLPESSTKGGMHIFSIGLG
ncbi:polysaccharide lyase family protein [Streptomyces sp. NPDC057582]|uniref:glycoside hydrolase family 38 N-terminal domain-containing protein n=1 Tax=Streptomyces sp. NPDC057582 TaxID=3346174 RepID=UPI0036C805C9